jgi:Yersinia/Haemophilus virulence surface antigen
MGDRRSGPPALAGATTIQSMPMKGSLTDQDFDNLLSKHGLHRMELDPIARGKMDRLRYSNEQLLRQSGRSSKLKRKYREALEGRLQYIDDYLARYKTQTDLERHGLRQSLNQHFYQVYTANLKFAFSQGLYVSGDQGVCREMCFHWIARKRKGKATFADSKHGKIGPATGLDGVRMRKKFQKYHELRKGANQVDFDAELKHYGLTSSKPEAMPILGLFSLEHMKVQNVTAADFLGAVTVLTAGSHVLAVKGADSSHVIALVIGTGVEFMDPNLGEFEFNDDATFIRFITDWWNKCMKEVVGTASVYTGSVMHIQ